MLQQALEKQYASDATGTHNEVVLDSRSIESGLPGSVLAFFWVGGRRDETAALRDAFCAQFGLAAADVPLLRYDFGAVPAQAFSL